MDLKRDLIAAYKRYGFTLARDASNQGILVFTLKTGYFENAEIVKLSAQAATDSVFQEFSRIGYACTVRETPTAQSAEEDLFNGFFSVAATRGRLRDDYSRFTRGLVKPYGADATYEYIKAQYQIDGKVGSLTPPEEVLARINDEEPILFLIEAAAGFGKTCTAQEIVRLLADHSTRLPLYAELSRNRQARIFRYILLDEIDRTFPLLNSTLVQTEIKNGRIATILDGFDELLRKGEEAGDFENREPMLETISEMLTGRAKVIITTRRTVLFDGDEFHQWLDRHAGVFSVVRIRIQEPKVSEWLPHARVEALEKAGLNLNAMANPVLLSYLKCISEQRFAEALAIPESIVQSYFEYMLDREVSRQDLHMTTANQGKVLAHIASDMISRGYTAERRDYIIKLVLEACSDLIEHARSQYSSSDRPSRDEVANKLASHALLDRSSSDAGKIGFVNEFCLGNYVAETIIGSQDWMGDDARFIDPAVRSYAPRTEISRRQLFEGLKESLPYLGIGAQVEVSAQLLQQLPSPLKDGEVDGLNLNGLNVGSERIESIQFNEVVFRNCTFVKNGLDNVTFLNCRFFDCKVIGDVVGAVYVLGGQASPDILGNLQAQPPMCTETDEQQSRNRALIKAILRRFWPVGDPLSQRPSRPVFKPMKFLCQPFDGYSMAELYRGVEELQNRDLLIEKNRSSLITLNLDRVAEASALLEEAS